MTTRDPLSATPARGLRSRSTLRARKGPAAGLVLVLSLALWPAAPGGVVSAGVLDRVVATVNGKVITESELREMTDLFQHQEGAGSRPDASEWEQASMQRRILEELVDRKLMDDYASKNGISASDEEIEQAVKEVQARGNITREQLMESLRRDGVSYEEYRDQIRDQIIKAKMIHKEVRAQVSVKDEQIEAYYLEHPDDFRSEEGFFLSHILLGLPQNPRPEVVEAVMNEARRIRGEVLAGVPFADAAAKYSQDASAARGGRLGFFRQGALSGDLESTILGMQEGEVSEPIRTSAGVHIVRLEEKTSGEIRSLDRVRDTIREKLFEEAAERQFEEWRKNLRKSAYIEILL
ncbi:MAG: SurA N-terminal domain-containing protein [bacterium]